MAAAVTNMILVSREVTRVVKHRQKAEGCWSESEGSRKEQMAKKEGAGVLMLMMMVQEVFKFKISSMMNYYYY